jgi:putative transposase
VIQTDLYSFSYKKGTLVPWCKRCTNKRFYKDGKTSYGKQIYKCKKCGFRFVWCSDLPNRRFFSNVIDFAIDLYTTIGIGLRTLARKLMKFFDIKVSHEGIRQWVLAGKQELFVDQSVDNCQTWSADETYIKVKGKGHWLWIVYCIETKQILAWHISQKRLLKDAITLFKKAKLTAGGNPKCIITDGLYQYDTAIKKVMLWRLHERRRKHIIDSGVGKNSHVERVNREVKRRIKWFSTFQCLQGAKAFFSLFFHYFNLRTAQARKNTA